MELQQLEQLADQYGSLLYSFCLRLTGHRENGEDLCQQAFLKAVELRERIDVQRSPKSFLFALAVGIWKNEKRKLWRRRKSYKKRSAGNNSRRSKYSSRRCAARCPKRYRA